MSGPRAGDAGFEEQRPAAGEAIGADADAVVTGTRWMVASQLATQLARLGVSVVLARLLDPTHFGLLAAAMVVVTFLDVFKDIGTGVAVIQRREVSDGLLSSVFCVNICIGLVLTAALLAAAPQVARLLDDESATSVLRAISPAVFMSSCGHVHQALLRRSMSFRRLAGIALANALGTGTVSIGLAIAGAGVWSLVAGILTGSAVTLGMVWWSSAWRPRWHFRWDEFRQVVRFGVNVSVADLLQFMVFHADKALVARYVGARGLGFYSFAQRLLMYPVYSFTYMLTEVLFPVFSRHQEDNASLRKGVLRACSAIALVTLPLTAGIALVARPLVTTMLGTKWEPVVPLVWILAPIGGLQSVSLAATPVFLAKGRSDLLLRWGVLSGTVVLAAYIIGVRWGLIGISAAYAAAIVVLTYPGFRLAFRLIGLRFGELVSALRPGLVATAAMASAVAVLRFLTERAGVRPSAVLVLCVVCGVAVYGAVILRTRPPALEDVVRMVPMARRFAELPERRRDDLSRDHAPSNGVGRTGAEPRRPVPDSDG